MRILWNENEKRFEAQFSTGEMWQSDKDAAQGAGFRTDGPPAWIWRATKAAVLDKLKTNRPASGLAITKEALDAYNRLRAIEERDIELEKFAKEQKKLQKKEQERAKIEAEREDGEEVSPEYETTRYRPVPEYWKGKHEITRADLPADVVARLDKHEPVPVRKAEPTGKCKVCGEPTYDPEESDFCLWCSGHGEENFFEELLDN
jgi:hypothetical protein